MFPEHRQLHEELNTFNRMEVNEMCEIIFVMVVWIGQTIATNFATFPRADANHVDHFVKPFELCVGRNEVADS
jgi:hypothetical protein